MRYGNFLIRAGVFLILIGLSSLAVYYASIFQSVRDWYLVIVAIVFALCIFSVLFDETIGNLIGNVQAEVIRGIGVLIPLIIVSVSFLIASAIRWTFLVTLIQFSLLGLILLGALGVVLFAVINRRSEQQHEQSTGYSNPFLPR